MKGCQKVVVARRRAARIGVSDESWRMGGRVKNVQRRGCSRRRLLLTFELDLGKTGDEPIGRAESQCRRRRREEGKHLDVLFRLPLERVRLLPSTLGESLEFDVTGVEPTSYGRLSVRRKGKEREGENDVLVLLLLRTPNAGLCGRLRALQRLLEILDASSSSCDLVLKPLVLAGKGRLGLLKVDLRRIENRVEVRTGYRTRRG